jgi:23S rRNA pseudouridine1911/1915/1917 synthase
MTSAIEVLYEDNHLLAINKPAPLPTMGVCGSRANLLAQAKSYLKQKYAKPGNVYLGVVSRLDSVATGVVLFARTSKAAARLSAQFRQRHVTKVYWAVTSGPAPETHGLWVDWLCKDEVRRRMTTCRPDELHARQARLEFERLRTWPGHALLEIHLLTGRKHQIRVQCARRGYPIVGDRKYGSQEPFPAGIALHARRLVVDHPVRHEPIELVAPLPASWARFPVAS